MNASAWKRFKKWSSINLNRKKSDIKIQINSEVFFFFWNKVSLNMEELGKKVWLTYCLAWWWYWLKKKKIVMRKQMKRFSRNCGWSHKLASNRGYRIQKLCRSELNLQHKHGQSSENEEATPSHRYVCQETSSRKVATNSTRADSRNLRHCNSLSQPGTWMTLLIYARDSVFV